MKEYFDAAKSWYYVKYIQSLRFIIVMVVIATVAIMASFFSVQEAYTVIIGRDPVTKVISTTYDASLFPVMEKIGKIYHSNDLNILHYTIKTYVTNFETYDKSENQHLVFIEKAKYMQDYSSSAVMKTLQDKFNNEYLGMLNNGGFVRAVVQDISFDVYKPTLLEKTYTFLMPEPIPSTAIATVMIYIFDGAKLQKRTVNIEIDFAFQKIQRQKDGRYNTIKFFVSDYKYL